MQRVVSSSQLNKKLGFSSYPKVPIFDHHRNQMVLGKRTREHSTDSNEKPISSSPLRKMQQDDVSGVESMLRRRKQPKTTPVSSPSNNKMAWTKDDELIILGVCEKPSLSLFSFTLFFFNTHTLFSWKKTEYCRLRKGDKAES